MTNADTILEFGRNRIEQMAANFSVGAGANVAVDGAFPSFVISGKAKAEAQNGLKRITLNPLMVVLGNAQVTVTPGYVLGDGDSIYEPAINGQSIFNTPPPALSKYPLGGYVWLRRRVVVSVIDSSFGYNTISADFDGGFEFVTTPVPESDPDTKYTATAYGYQHGADIANYDFMTITGEGYLHQLMCQYNALGKYLYRGFGFFDSDHPPGTLVPASYLWQTADATAKVAENITAINPA